MSAKPRSQFLGENVFGQPVCGSFKIFDMLKII